MNAQRSDSRLTFFVIGTIVSLIWLMFVMYGWVPLERWRVGLSGAAIILSLTTALLVIRSPFGEGRKLLRNAVLLNPVGSLFLAALSAVLIGSPQLFPVAMVLMALAIVALCVSAVLLAMYLIKRRSARG